LAGQLPVLDSTRKRFTPMAYTPHPSRPITLTRRALALAALAAAFAHPTPALAADRIRVTATVGMIGDAVATIGGDHVDLTTLMGPGIDPHLYKPSARDIDALGDTDLIVYGGLHLEGRMVDLFEQIHQLDIPAVAVGEAIPEDRLLVLDGAHDPHIWFSVPLWQIAVEATRDALIAVAPEHAETFDTNAAAYRTELDALDGYVRDRTAAVPEHLRVLVTAHDAFGYFGSAYGYEVHAIQGLSTTAEAGAGDIQDLADFLAAREIPAIFVESSVPRGTVEALREATRSRGWDVAIGGELFSDAMGTAGTPEGTYIGMVTHNIDTIVAGLTGDTSEEDAA
jgi:manganese/zinc/iron transport system substrate-binding protein